MSRFSCALLLPSLSLEFWLLIAPVKQGKLHFQIHSLPISLSSLHPSYRQCLKSRFASSLSSNSASTETLEGGSWEKDGARWIRRRGREEDGRPAGQNFENQTKTFGLFPKGNQESWMKLTEGRKWFLKMEFNEGCLWGIMISYQTLDAAIVFTRWDWSGWIKLGSVSLISSLPTTRWSVSSPAPRQWPVAGSHRQESKARARAGRLGALGASWTELLFWSQNHACKSYQLSDFNEVS